MSRQHQHVPRGCADLIKARVSLPDALDRYGVRMVRDRMPCFLHGGADRNMRVYDQRAYCYVCHRYADVVDFVMYAFGINYTDALIKIDQDFSLGLTGATLDRQKQAKIRTEIIGMENARRERENAEMAKFRLLDALANVDCQARATRHSNEPFTDQWCAAVEAMFWVDLIWREVETR